MVVLPYEKIKDSTANFIIDYIENVFAKNAFIIRLWIIQSYNIFETRQKLTDF